MRYLDGKSMKDLATLVASGDQRTKGRLVTVVADQSGPYSSTYLLFALVLFFVVPVSLGAFFDVYLSANVFLAQIIFVVCSFLLLSWTRFGMKLIPASLRTRYCLEKANFYFVNNNLHRHSRGAGVLLYVSAAENEIRFIADKEITSKVSDDVWQEIHRHAEAKLKQGQIKASIAFAVEACQALLGELYPAEGDKDKKDCSEFITVAAV